MAVVEEAHRAAVLSDHAHLSLAAAPVADEMPHSVSTADLAGRSICARSGRRHAGRAADQRRGARSDARGVDGASRPAALDFLRFDLRRLTATQSGCRRFSSAGPTLLNPIGAAGRLNTQWNSPVSDA